MKALVYSTILIFVLLSVFGFVGMVPSHDGEICVANLVNTNACRSEAPMAEAFFRICPFQKFSQAVLVYLAVLLLVFVVSLRIKVETGESSNYQSSCDLAENNLASLPRRIFRWLILRQKYAPAHLA